MLNFGWVTSCPDRHMRALKQNAERSLPKGMANMTIENRDALAFTLLNG